MTGTFQRIVIIGVGLIGGSVAAAVRHNLPDVEVFGIDTRSEALDVGLGSGLLAAGALPDDPRTAVWLAEGGSDLVIVATPADAAQHWFVCMAEGGYDGVVTDVASTKHVTCGMADALLPHPERYIPGHPMAGSEMSGVEAASAALFQGAYWILCPDEHTLPDAYRRLHSFVVALGARVISIDRDAHDDAVAIVSHVPHIVASALVRLAADHARTQPNLLRLAAGGFKDSTRIAAGSPELWTGISFDNRDAVVAGLHEFGGIVASFEEAVRDHDEKALEDLLEQSAKVRRALPAKWVPDSSRLVECRIPMYNRKGVIAEVTTIASEAGCNIQSIDIDHMSDSSAVLDLIFTDEGDIGRLSADLIGAGYDFSFRPLSDDSGERS